MCDMMVVCDSGFLTSVCVCRYDLMELGSKEINVRQYLGWFQFKGGDQQKRVGVSDDY